MGLVNYYPVTDKITTVRPLICLDQDELEKLMHRTIGEDIYLTDSI